MTEERIQQLLHILWYEVKDSTELHCFVQTYGSEIDYDFFAAINKVIQSYKLEGNPEVVHFFENVISALWRLFPIEKSKGDEVFSGANKDLSAGGVEILNTNYAIIDLLDHNPNEAYQRAVASLVRAKQMVIND
jgi:hypothetical protein